MRYILVMAYLALFFITSVAQVSATPATDSSSCSLPHADFKYSYMDSAIGSMQKPNHDVFLNTATNHMDAVKAQFYLWYLYRNPTLSDQFFRRVDVALLVKRGDDALNAIIWLMSKDGRYFSSVQSEVRARLISNLDKWKINYNKASPEQSLILDFFVNDKNFASHLDGQLKSYAGNDVDLILQKGIQSENDGRKLEALYYYTEVAGYGYRDGLIGASLLLPQLGGDACVSRASYYVRLSGAIGDAGWLERAH
jgi:hypothetical protein